MNFTQLARILKVTPQELRDKLPLLGFSIGAKAIKVNNNIANKIIKEWPSLKRKLEFMEEDKRAREEEEKQENKEIIKIKIPKFITVRDFATISTVPVNKVLAELMKNGVFASLNERIDFETASIIADDLGLEVSLDDREEEEQTEENEVKKVIEKESKDKLQIRPPVIVVMGHVDHGKTKLLDAIRKTNVVDGEAGGITQHIGAYQIKRKEEVITFIDTPGHEAFTAMRSRGAKIADIAILVVAADDGVKPQTVEAFRIIEAANIPYLVAINKIDKPDANVDKTKQELSSQLGITPEDWGGKIICAPISAKEGTGIEDLLDMVLLTSETSDTDLVANPDASAIGTVIESHVDKGAGPVATILIQNGTIRIGDQLVMDNKIFGKVRALYDYRNKIVEEAIPSMPVKIVGLKALPEVGDILKVGKGEKVKLKKLSKSSLGPSAQVETEEESCDVKKINLVIKSDVLGSAEAIEESLEKINTDEVQIKILHKGLGNITDGDIRRAEASCGMVISFNVQIPSPIAELAREKNIEIKSYSIIYDLINDIKAMMEEMIEPEEVRKDLGRFKVMAIFRTDNKGQILGGKVIEGQVESDAMVEVERDKEKIERGKIVRVQSGKEEVKMVEENQECGLSYEGSPIVREDDILHIYKMEKIIKKL